MLHLRILNQHRVNLVGFDVVKINHVTFKQVPHPFALSLGHPSCVNLILPVYAGQVSAVTETQLGIVVVLGLAVLCEAVLYRNLSGNREPVETTPRIYIINHIWYRTWLFRIIGIITHGHALNPFNITPCNLEEVC